MIMGHLITKAIPTEVSAIEYLKDHPTLHEGFAISPLTAKKIYGQYIHDIHEFVCPTDGCSAKVTGHSIKPEHKRSPAFITSCRVDSAHIEVCKFHPKNKDLVFSKSNNPAERFERIKTGDIVSDLSGTQGFSPRKSVSTKKESPDKDATETQFYLPSSSKKQDLRIPRSKRPTREHLKTLQDHVEMFKYDPEFKVTRKSNGAVVPIKYLFKPISANCLFEELTDQKYPTIYYGEARLAKTQKESVISIRFKHNFRKNTLNYSDRKNYFLSLLISKEYLMKEYPDIYSVLKKRNDYLFKVYTTLPMFWNVTSDNAMYLNVSSFKKAMRVDAFTDELFSNIFISQ